MQSTFRSAVPFRPQLTDLSAGTAGTRTTPSDCRSRVEGFRLGAPGFGKWTDQIMGHVCTHGPTHVLHPKETGERLFQSDQGCVSNGLILCKLLITFNSHVHIYCSIGQSTLLPYLCLRMDDPPLCITTSDLLGCIDAARSEIAIGR